MGQGRRPNQGGAEYLNPVGDLEGGPLDPGGKKQRQLLLGASYLAGGQEGTSGETVRLNETNTAREDEPLQFKFRGGAEGNELPRFQFRGVCQLQCSPHQQSLGEDVRRMQWSLSAHSVAGPGAHRKDRLQTKCGQRRRINEVLRI